MNRPAGRPSSSRRGPSVLLIDHDADERQMYAECLRIEEFQPIEVDNTAEGMTRAEEADVIVTGIRVPGPLNGIDLVKQLRARDRTRRKPIIVLSACAFDSDRNRARAAGCSVFLAKPCLPDTLTQHIRRLLCTAPATRSMRGCFRRGSRQKITP